jgi:putative addiction module antidote
MPVTVKLRKIGNSLGLILPKDIAVRLRLSEGDMLHVIPDTEGARITPYDPQFEASMAAFEHTRRKYRNALHLLAKT